VCSSDLFANTAFRGWRNAEAGRQIYTAANAIIETMDEDLGSAFTLEPAGTDQTMAFLTCGRLDDGSPLLHFVRTIEAGPERRYLARAGEGGPNGASYDGVTIDRLRTLGGLMEVVYYKDGERLMRAVLAPPTKQLHVNRANSARPVADGVIYFDLRFWDPWSQLWEADDPYKWTGWPANRFPAVALPIWDSTRAWDDPILASRGYVVPDSIDDPTDDVYPEGIRITIVVDADEKVRRMNRLREAVTDADGRLQLDSPAGIPGPKDPYPFIYVEKEWMRVTAKDGARITVKRAQRGTVAVDHAVRAEVRVGETFERELYMPAHRRDYLQRPK
jgi:hypothetical protein